MGIDLTGRSAFVRVCARRTPPPSCGRRRAGAATAALAAILAAVLLSGCGSPAGTPLPTAVPSAIAGSQPTGTQAATGSPGPGTTPPLTGSAPAHIVVVVFENHGSRQILGSGRAPAFDALAARGVSYTRSYAITHPSEPNYLALFSGSTHGIGNDSCPNTFAGSNLARQVLDSGHSFIGYAESLPHAGYLGCSSGDYARKHAPWTNFTDLPPTVNQPYSTFPTDYDLLPTVSFVVPNLCHDMHNCSIATGDAWLRANMTAYAAWATTHHSLLVVTFDEDDSAGPNIIPTIIVGQGVTPGRATEVVDHYTLLRTIEGCLGLPPLGVAAARTPMPEICR